MTENETGAALDDEEPTTLDEAERAELKNPGYEIFIAVLSILSIVNLLLMVAVQDQALDYVLLLMNAVLSLVLFIDFCFRLFTAESRSTYFFRKFGWADLLASVPVAEFKILRVFRLISVYRLLREYGVRNIGRSLLAEKAGSALLTLLLIAILVMEFGSLGMLRLEENAPNANITTASDALWYVIVTMSTVGYGDTYPVTNGGRLLGSCIIVVGVGIFGTLSGYLANLFLKPRRKPAADAAVSPEAADEGGPGDEPIDLRLARLARAGALRDAGVLTADEFESTKTAILHA